MTKAIKKVTGSIFGGGGATGMMGTGKFKGTTFKDFNKEPFKQKLTGAGHQEAARKKQVSQTQRLEDRATGKAPSIAEAQLKQASSRSLAQQLAAAKSQRGGSAGAQQRMLAKAAASERQKISEQASTEKLKEQQLAEQSLAQQLQAQRAQDVNIAEADRASAQKLQELLMNENLGVQGLNLSGFQSAAQTRSGLFSGAMSSLAAMSDENKKTKIKDEGIKKDPSKMSDEEFKKAHAAGMKKQKEQAKADKVAKRDKNMNDHFAKAKEKGVDKKEAIKAWNKKQATAGVASAKKRRAEEKESKFAKFASAFGKNQMKLGGDSGAGRDALKTAMARISDEENKKNIKTEELEIKIPKIETPDKNDLKGNISTSAASKGVMSQIAKLAKGKKLDTKGLPLAAQLASKGPLSQLAQKAMSDEENKKNIKTEELEVKIPKVPKVPEVSKKDDKKSDIMSQIAKVAGPAIAAAMSDKEEKKESKSYSDKEIKVEVKDDDFNPKSFLDALKAYSYEYKDNAKKEAKGGEGRFLSPMAQDIEKAGPVGKSMVVDTPKGKIVDYGKGFGAILAAQAHLNERLKELESKKK